MNAENSSEFRKDIVSGDWVLIATGRKKRPQEFVSKEKKEIVPKEGCPFEDPQASGNSAPSIVYPEGSGKRWRIQVIENKYPAVSSEAANSKISSVGPYAVIQGSGYHDVVITRDHFKNFSKLSDDEAVALLKVFIARYKAVAADKRVTYVSIFHNWGKRAGASVFHPHYQMISIPVIPPDVEHSLQGSTSYFHKNKKCVHCSMIDWEKLDRKRIIYENDGALVFTPFVSKEPFEFRVFPKKHLSYFEDSPEKDLSSVALALKTSLAMLEKKMPGVDYNMFIHTAPVKNKAKYGHYHWHVEVQPKISISGGFELGTGIEITVVDPEEAASFIRGDESKK